MGKQKEGNRKEIIWRILESEESKMSANVDLEKVAALIGESIDFVRVNLQVGTLLIDGEPIGYAVKKRKLRKISFM